MYQIKTGRYIARKRKEKNFTQEELAEKLGVSNKTVSKWETGKNMPDYSVVKTLCDTLEITISELMEGEDADRSCRLQEDQIVELLRRSQEIEKQKKCIIGLIYMTTSTSIGLLADHFDGSPIEDLVSTVLLILSVVVSAFATVFIWKGLSDHE